MTHPISKPMAYNIKSEEEYLQVMEKVETYLQRATAGGGFQGLSSEEQEDLHHLSLMAEAWEDNIPLMPIRQPQTLVEMIELKMYERKLKQKDLAKLLEISTSRLSEVLKGRRRVNIDLANRLYLKLNIEPQFILEKAVNVKISSRSVSSTGTSKKQGKLKSNGLKK